MDLFSGYFTSFDLGWTNNGSFLSMLDSMFRSYVIFKTEIPYTQRPGL